MSVSEQTSFIRPRELWLDLGLQAGQHVVHLGCGAGFYLIPAAKIVGRSGSVIGVDILPHLLAEAEGRANREGLDEVVKTVRANLESDNGSNLSPHSADWVLVANILHQADAPKILAEAHRIVKPRGQVIVIGWSTAATPMGPPAEKRVSAAAAREFARGAGLAELRSFEPSPYHYGLIFKPLTL